MSCLQCPHCIGQGRFGLIDENDPALKKKVFTGYIGGATSGVSQGFQVLRLHKSKDATFGMCGAYAFRYKDRRSGASVDRWEDVTCPRCLIVRPGVK